MLAVTYAGVLALAAYTLFCVAPALAARLAYPGPLEHQEGLVVDLGLRFVRGYPLYSQPSASGYSLIYSPLYLEFVRIVAGLLGSNFVALRAVSMFLLLGSAAFALLTLRAMRSPAASYWLWPIGFLVGFGFVGWIDLIRIDALLLCGTMALCWRLAGARGVADWIVAGVVLALLIGVKFTAGAIAAALLALALFERRMLVLVGTAILGAVLIYGVSYALYGQAMLDWVFRSPATHPLERGNAYAIVLWLVIATPLWLGAIAAVQRLDIRLTEAGASLAGSCSTPVLRLYALSAGVFAMCALSALKQGGGLASFAVLSGPLALFFAHAVGRAAARDAPGREVPAPEQRVLVIAALAAGLVIAALGAHGLRSLAPRPSDGQQLAAFLNRVRAEPGQVWIVSHPWVVDEGQRQPTTAIQQIGAEWRDPRLPADLRAILASKGYSAIYTGDDFLTASFRREFREALCESYAVRQTLAPDQTLPSFGAAMFAPDRIWRPRTAPPSGAELIACVGPSA